MRETRICLQDQRHSTMPVLDSKSLISKHINANMMFNSYGEKGSAIIQQMLFSMFPPSVELTAILRPLTHQQFMTYFLVPFVAVLLISEDYGYTTDAKAHKIMVTSGDAGILVHPADDNDTALDEIMQKIILVFRSGKPEILTRGVDSTEEAAQTLLQLQGQTAKASLIPQLCISTDVFCR